MTKTEQKRAIEYTTLTPSMRAFINSIVGCSNKCKRMVESLQREKPEGWLQKCVDLYENAIAQTNVEGQAYRFFMLRDDYADFLRENNQLQESLDLYEDNVKQTRERLKEKPYNKFYKREVVRNDYMLALLHMDDQYEQAEQEFKEAIGICRDLAETDPDIFLEWLAKIIKYYADLHRQLNQYELAEQEYIEAIEIYRKLVEVDSEIYLPELAESVDHYADMLNELERYEQVEEVYKEAIEIYKRLVIFDSSYNKYLAIYLYNLANFCWAQGRQSEALQRIDEAVSVAPDDADNYDIKGDFLLKLGRTDEALELYNHVLALNKDYYKEEDSDLYNGLKERGLI